MPRLRLALDNTYRRCAVALAGGVVLSFAWPEADFGPLAWVCVAPLLWLAGTPGERGLRRGAVVGFAFGIGFFGALLSWVSIVGWVAWAALVFLQACFLGLFGMAWAAVAPTVPRWWRPAAAAGLWVSVEGLRAAFPVLGFPWGQLAQSQHDALWLLRSAGIGGGWLVTALVVACNGLVLEAVLSRVEPKRALLALGAAAGTIALPVLLPSSQPTGSAIDVAIIQGNVPRDVPESLEKEFSITSSHASLTTGLADRGVDLAVWPESSVGVDPNEYPEFGDAIASAARAIDTPMIVGSNLDGPSEDTYVVAALQIGSDGSTERIYRKTHLVPFGEYVPGRSFLGWIPMLDQVPTDAVAGDEAAVFDIAGGRIAPVISFEGDFGPLVRGRIASGGRLLVVATNTSTWENSWASAQHVAFSQVRAAENGVWTVHAAVSGISAFISPDGGIVERLPNWSAGTLVHEVVFADEVSFYARTGDWLVWLSVLGSTFLLARSARPSRRSSVTP